jgi:hypothetical protein
MAEKRLTKEIAEKFLVDPVRRGLDGFTELDNEAAALLSKHKEALDLCGLESLSDAAARILSMYKGRWLELNGLKHLSDTAAESLSKCKGLLQLAGLKHLSDSAAKALGKHRGELCLNGLESLSDIAAKNLSKHKGRWLELDGLKQLSDTAFESLSKYKGWLDLGVEVRRIEETNKPPGIDAEIPPGLDQRQSPSRSSDPTQGGLPVSQRPETTARRSGQQPQQDKGRMARTQRSDMPVGRRGEGAQQSNCLRMPSRFDELRDSSHAISWRLWKYRIVPVLVVVVGSVFLGESLGGGVVALVGFFVAAFAARTIVDAILKAVSVRFTSLCSTLSQIQTEIARLRKAMQRLMAAHPTRRKHEQFKVTFKLRGRTISDLEKVLAIGMHKERKEVYVTAFIRDGVAVRVTAAIGSARSCRGADDKNLWREHIQRLRCDEIRHYHNHPDYSNRTTPSPTDFRHASYIEGLLTPSGVTVSSYVVYWNQIGEWRLLKYNGEGNHLVHSVFDVNKI